VSGDFLADQHGRLSCVFCHGGDHRKGLTKDEAHEGLVAYPSDGEAPGCSGCHEDIVDRHKASIHGTQQGYFTSFAKRIGSDVITPGLQEMFDADCAKCHTSCGQCHISQPVSVDGGFIKGHEVRKTPNQTRNCTACHGSRVGDEFRGVNAGFSADAHYLRSMNCMGCHTGDELHGDGTTPASRYDVENGPTCTDAGCHAGVLSEPEGTEHSIHCGSVQCQVCHSVGYKNCYNCHVGEGLQFPSQMDFRIGRNPEPTEDRPWEYVLLRHVPLRPDSYSDYGVTMPQYASRPTWLYTTPHNIQRNTPQTESCETCHGNPDVFLTPAYIDSLIAAGLMVAAEEEANGGVVVHDLPER
jgi:thiosulfate/3-mercaptopyruvate sulfurtransferase